MFDIAPILEKNESQDHYFYKLCSQKDEMGYTWEDITDIMNDLFDLDCGESKYRKDWTTFVRIFNSNKNDILNYSDEDFLKKKDEIYKAKRQLSDQRREYNKLLTKDARFDNLSEKMIVAIDGLKSIDYSYLFNENSSRSNDEAVLLLSDWHYGQFSDNIWNRYNVDICKNRVKSLFKKSVDVLKTHSVKRLHIALLGDMFNGAIHTTSRVLSEENTCDQIINVSEILANFIDAISNYVQNVKVYSTYGNHARTIQSKDESVHSDNMEKIIPWWITQRLKENNKIEVVKSQYYEFTYFKVCGRNIVCTHGDLDKFKDIGTVVNNIFTKKFNMPIDYTFSGDKHHIESFEQFGVESVLIGSLCGTDEFANNKRLYSMPSQTMCIFNDKEGKVCTYNIKL